MPLHNDSNIYLWYLWSRSNEVTLCAFHQKTTVEKNQFKTDPLVLQPLEIAEVPWWSSITLAVNQRPMSHVFMICSCPFIHLANKRTSQSPSFQHCSLKSTVILSDFKKKYIYILNKNGTFLTNKNLSGNIHQTKRKGCVLPGETMI